MFSGSSYKVEIGEVIILLFVPKHGIYEEHALFVLVPKPKSHFFTLQSIVFSLR